MKDFFLYKLQEELSLNKIAYAIAPFYAICLEHSKAKTLTKNTEIAPVEFNNFQCLILLSAVRDYILPSQNIYIDDKYFSLCETPGQALKMAVSECLLMEDFAKIKALCYDGNFSSQEIIKLYRNRHGGKANTKAKQLKMSKELKKLLNIVNFYRILYPSKNDPIAKNWTDDFLLTSQNYQPCNSIRLLAEKFQSKHFWANNYKDAFQDNIVFEEFPGQLGFSLISKEQLKKYDFNYVIFCIAFEKFIEYFTQRTSTMKMPSKNMPISEFLPNNQNGYFIRETNTTLRENFCQTETLPLSMLIPLVDIVDNPLLPFKQKFIDKVLDFTKSNTFKHYTAEWHPCVPLPNKEDLNFLIYGNDKDSKKKEFKNRIKKQMTIVHISSMAQLKKLANISGSSKFLSKQDTVLPDDTITYETLERLAIPLHCCISYLRLTTDYSQDYLSDYDLKTNCFSIYENEIVLKHSFENELQSVVKYTYESCWQDTTAQLDAALEKIPLPYLRYALYRKIELETAKEKAETKRKTKTTTSKK